ncbi:MAG: alanine dehydrogenase, partial [Gammaproteobacteria bacterium]|nr:alanine dehydrogenase [Gammaproteobacteria bacterium]
GLPHAPVDNRTKAVAYEAVEHGAAEVPLLAPMSAVPGTMAHLVGSYYLASFNAGKGIQLGTVLGRKHGNVVIIGDGVVGKHAANVAAGMGANVVIFGQRPERAAQLKQEISNDIDFVIYEPERVAEQLEKADLVIGAVLRHGARASHVVTTEMIKRMEPGSVVVDVSIDQGGCFETSRPTSHSDPIYVEHDVIHYCVTNMPGAFPKTSTIALSEAILPYVLKLAGQGLEVLRSDPGFAKGLNTHQGFISYKPVAEALDMLPIFRPFVELV